MFSVLLASKLIKLLFWYHILHNLHAFEFIKTFYGYNILYSDSLQWCVLGHSWAVLHLSAFNWSILLPYTLSLLILYHGKDSRVKISSSSCRIFSFSSFTFCFILFGIFLGSGFLCVTLYSVDQAGLKFAEIFLTLPPECWD